MRYLGEWELVPELCLYAVGEVPAAGRYAIATEADGRLSLRITWRMPGDQEDRHSAFGGPKDGTPIALPPSAAGPDSFTLTEVNAHILDSAAFRDGRRVAYARRACSADGTLLAVLQEIVGADGSVLRNFQVYRRASP